MKMTSREKAMLIFLMVVALLAGSYYLVITPELKKYNKLVVDQADYRTQVKTVDAQLAGAATLQKGVEDLLAGIDKETKLYFPSILTEKLLVVLNDLYTKNGLLVSSAVFSAPASVAAPATSASKAVPAAAKALSLAEIRDKFIALSPVSGTPTPKPSPTPAPATPADPAVVLTSMASLTGMTVTLDFSAPYESMTGFIAGIEALGRSIAITSLTSSQQEDGSIAGKMDLVFYALPKLTGQDDPYVEWTYNDKYGKPNPFAAPGYDVTVGVLPFAAGLPNMTVSVPFISKPDVLAGSNAAPAEVELVFAQSGTAYTCRFRIGTTFFPAGGTVTTPFVPVGKTLRVLVASTLRTGTTDLSGVTLIVRNTTDRPVQVALVGDDTVRPRITIGTLDGKVTVR